MKIDKRLDDLEQKHEVNLLNQWDEFVSKFSDDEIETIAEGQADDKLLDRWSKGLDLTLPREMQEIYDEIVQGMKDRGEL